MEFLSINPKDGTTIAAHPAMSVTLLQATLNASVSAFKIWRKTNPGERAQCLYRLADLIDVRAAALAQLITDEMGKMRYESEAELKKCSLACRYFADHSAVFLGEEETPTRAMRSYLSVQPLGPILGVMPWNFPFWQVLRFAIPSILAGNTILLKHAETVLGCALAMENLFAEAGFPENTFRSLLIRIHQIESVIAHPSVRGVALTGSEKAGKAVSILAGTYLKPAVMELGGSDAYVILDDADMDLAVRSCARSRFRNAGQVCLAAKRIILTPGIYDDFRDTLHDIISNLSFGDPNIGSHAIGPMARSNLRDTIHHQLVASVRSGASLTLGGHIPDCPGFFYPPSLVEEVTPGMPLFEEETFGPVAVLIRATDEEHAIGLANASRYGLGASVFSADLDKAEFIAKHRLEAGACFVNEVVSSDPAIPFGGIKASGFGRELGSYGVKAFANLKHVAVY